MRTPRWRSGESLPKYVASPIDGRARLAANLRRLRARRGWSQEALADRAGIHRTYLGSVERAERNIAVDNICRLAWALGADVRELLAPTRREG